MFNADTNFNEVALSLEGLADALPEQVEEALNRLTNVVKQDLEREIQAGTYDRRIPTLDEYRPTKPARTRPASTATPTAAPRVERDVSDDDLFAGTLPGGF